MGKQQTDKKLVVVAQPRRARFCRKATAREVDLAVKPVQQPAAKVDVAKDRRQAS
mgnify:CR=1 FL=1